MKKATIMKNGVLSTVNRQQSTVIVLGEILADFVPEGRGHVLRPGGAVSNVAVNLRRLGVKSAIISRLGNDFLGRFLLGFLNYNGVDISGVSTDGGHKTGLVFVFHDKNKERDFSFYGSPSADQFLDPGQVKASAIKKAVILHFGSISMMGRQSARATLKAIRLARRNRLIVTFDPNVRLNLWENRHAQARRQIKGLFKYADVVKLSDKEFKFLFGAAPDFDSLGKVFGPKLVFLTKGAQGCLVKHGPVEITARGKKTRVTDTTGAGDAFMAGVIYGIISRAKGLKLSKKDIEQVAAFSNRLGAKAVSRKGAV